MPLVKPYDCSTIHVDNLEEYKALIRLQGAFDALLFLAFPVTLKKVAKIWFLSLLPRSIHSF